MSFPSSPQNGDTATFNGHLFSFDSDLNRWTVLQSAEDLKFDSEITVLTNFLYAGAQSTGFPVGAVVPFAASSFPDGFLLADGSTFNDLTYPDLYEFLGSTTLPDYTGRTFGFKVYDLSDETNYSDVHFGIAAYNGAGFTTDSDVMASLAQAATANTDSEINSLKARVTELEGDLTQAISDRVFTDNALAARLDGHDSDIALRGRFYVQATAPSGGPNSGWVNTNTMRLHIWDETSSVWTEVVTT